MKKLVSFFRSMRFGMLLLVLIIACSLAGSLIPQQREAAEYAARYGEAGAALVMALGFDDVFVQPYFIALAAALCLNLTLCSVVRLPGARRGGEALLRRAQNAQTAHPLGAGQADALRAYLKKRRWREADGVFAKRFYGFYGSFLTHLSILLVLATGASVLLLADVQDVVVMPGQTIALEDGTAVTVQAFQIEDETGRLDYASDLVMTAPDGKAAEGTIRVNEPMRLGAYKVYQQTYGTAGAIRVENIAAGAAEDLTLTESGFLTLDGKSGLFFRTLYPGYTENEDGGITIVTSTSGKYADPVYDVLAMQDGRTTPMLMFPGDEMEIGGVRFTILDPVSYPGLRIKRMDGWLLGAMYASFTLMIAALYLCFFAAPACVKVTQDGYAVISPKAQTGLELELDALLSGAKEDAV